MHLLLPRGIRTHNRSRSPRSIASSHVEECRSGKSAKWIRKLARRIGSRGWCGGVGGAGLGGSGLVGSNLRRLAPLYPPFYFTHRTFTTNLELERTRGIRLFN